MKVRIGTLDVGRMFMTSLTWRPGQVQRINDGSAQEPSVDVLLVDPSESKTLHPGVVVTILEPA